ncbi:MAG TPA: TonB family protein [Phnomibacter sp.]|nr:TonB family protein [Phnomibacter sp.]
MMDANKLQHADFIDILFDGRNKEYGAYELRRSYNKRLSMAIAAMMGISLVVFVGAVISKDNRDKAVATTIVDNVELIDVESPTEELPPPPALPEPPAQIETAQFTPPVIVQDELVNPEDETPDVAKLDDVKIGTMNIDGDKFDGTVMPPQEAHGTGEAAAIQPEKEDWEKEFVKVEMEAQFPGGASAWKRYLERNMRYPDAAQDNGTQGVVKVQFLIDKDGNISEVEALNNPGDGIAEEAIRIIAKGPKWIPAEQNNRKVKYRQVQSITFRME